MNGPPRVVLIQTLDSPITALVSCANGHLTERFVARAVSPDELAEILRGLPTDTCPTCEPSNE